MNLLFVCSRNQWRSPTAERLFARHNGVKCRSAGTGRQARRTVRREDLNWADLVFVMEQHHKQRLKELFPQELRSCEVHVLDVPDEYGFMDPDLVELLEGAVGPILDSIGP